MRYCIRNCREEIPPIIHVETRRLGIFLNHLSAEEVEANKYELPDNAVSRKWFEETGGVNGEFYGMELNALKHAQRIKIITDGLNEIIDPDRYAEEIRKSYIRMAALESCHELIDAAIDNIVEEEEEKIELPGVTIEAIQQLALQGKNEFPIYYTDESKMIKRLQQIGVD